jgi:predicted RNA-binding protein with PIN domain
MYVVDGYNLFHAMKKRGALPENFGHARARLVELLSALARRESVKVHVFFDGTAGELGKGDLAYPRVRITFCGKGAGIADAAVREFVEESNDPGKLTVVSSDIEVVKGCKLAIAERLAGLAPADREAPERAEKPVRGMIGDLEREMLDEIGDFSEFQRRIESGD